MYSLAHMKYQLGVIYLMDRKLIDYLPLFVQDYAEIKAIMDAEQVDIVIGWENGENVMNDQFIRDATENGVKRWESILGIVPKATFTMDERKFQILSRLNWRLPYTLESLKMALTALCGENGYSLKLDTDKYELTVRLALSNENKIEAVSELLYNMIPANLVSIVRMFNTHSILTGFTHAHLAQYTQKEVREEIL